MTRNLLFDLAGVLVNLNIEKDTQALLSVGLPTFDECLRRPGIVRPVLGYLNGIVPEADFLPQIRPYCHPEATDEAILWSMNAVLDDLPASRLELLRRLRQRYRVYLLSNLNERDWLYTQRLISQAGYALADLFHQTFISYQLQLAKPDQRIYRHVIEATGLDPAETLYLDDTRENVEAAAALGSQSHLVPMNQLEQLLPQLQLQLGL